jgi:hypothetical protein
MPHANVWIRKEDWETWSQIENKAEFLHRALNEGLVTVPGSSMVEQRPVKAKVSGSSPDRGAKNFRNCSECGGLVSMGKCLICGKKV